MLSYEPLLFYVFCDLKLLSWKQLGCKHHLRLCHKSSSKLTALQKVYSNRFKYIV